MSETWRGKRACSRGFAWRHAHNRQPTGPRPAARRQRDRVGKSRHPRYGQVGRGSRRKARGVTETRGSARAALFVELDITTTITTTWERAPG